MRTNKQTRNICFSCTINNPCGPEIVMLPHNCYIYHHSLLRQLDELSRGDTDLEDDSMMKGTFLSPSVCVFFSICLFLAPCGPVVWQIVSSTPTLTTRLMCQNDKWKILIFYALFFFFSNIIIFFHQLPHPPSPPTQRTRRPHPCTIDPITTSALDTLARAFMVEI